MSYNFVVHQLQKMPFVSCHINDNILFQGALGLIVQPVDALDMASPDINGDLCRKVLLEAEHFVLVRALQRKLRKTRRETEVLLRDMEHAGLGSLRTMGTSMVFFKNPDITEAQLTSFRVPVGDFRKVVLKSRTKPSRFDPIDPYHSKTPVS